MPQKDRLSKTMRIDLIPDVPTETDQEARERVVVTTSGRRSRKRVASDVEGASSGYQQLLQSIYDAALICDMNGRIIDMNVRAIEFLLYGREEMQGMSILDIIAGADESLIGTLLENLEGERFTLIQAYCVRKNGTFFPAEVAVNRLEIGEGRLCFFVRDITLRRQSEEMLRTEHNAIQNAATGIAVADIEARLEYVNPAVTRMWGYDSSDDLLGKDVRDLLDDTDAASEMIGSVMANRESWTGEMRAVRLNAETFEVQVSAVCNRDSDGHTVGVVFSFLDISDRKRAEEAEKQAERHRVMLQSLGAACHHLGQPATVLLANLGILEKKISSHDPQVHDSIEASLSAIRSLSNILHKLNAVNEYKTTRYLAPTDESAEEHRILEI